MMRTLSLFICLFCTRAILAQQSFTVTDTQPLDAGGLRIGYNLLSEKEKEVGNKGDFSRFSIEFYVTNTSPEAKIILYTRNAALTNLGGVVQANPLEHGQPNARWVIEPVAD